MENVKILEHPLLQHKISRLRDETTGTNEFRALVEEIAMLMGYEALNDLPTIPSPARNIGTTASFLPESIGVLQVSIGVFTSTFSVGRSLSAS